MEKKPIPKDKSKVDKAPPWDNPGLKETMSRVEPPAVGAKRGRGRPRKEPETIPPVQPVEAEPTVIKISPDMVKPVINGLTTALETRFGAEFHYTEKSKDTITAALIPVLQKHSSRLFVKYGEEMVLILIVLGDTYPRLVARNDRLLKVGKEPESKTPVKKTKSSK